MPAPCAPSRPLSTYNFRLFFIGQLISNTGNQLTNVALILLVLKLGHSGLAPWLRASSGRSSRCSVFRGRGEHRIPDSVPQRSRRSTTRRDMHGRVLALQTVLIGGTALVGGPIVGQLADLAGGRAPIAIGRVVCFAAAGFGELARRRFSRGEARVGSFRPDGGRGVQYLAHDAQQLRGVLYVLFEQDGARSFNRSSTLTSEVVAAGEDVARVR